MMLVFSSWQLLHRLCDCVLCSRTSVVAVHCVIPAGLKKKLKDLMGEFSELRARIHEENRQVVERRVYAVTGQHLPEEEIDHMIETGGRGSWRMRCY